MLESLSESPGGSCKLEFGGRCWNAAAGVWKIKGTIGGSKRTVCFFFFFFFFFFSCNNFFLKKKQGEGPRACG